MVKLSDYGYNVMDSPKRREAALQKIVNAGYKNALVKLLHKNAMGLLAHGSYNGVMATHVDSDIEGRGRRYRNDAEKAEKMNVKRDD